MTVTCAACHRQWEPQMTRADLCIECLFAAGHGQMKRGDRIRDEYRDRILSVLDAAAEQEKQAVTYYSSAATFNADLCERALTLYNQARRLADAVRGME